jgi:ferredoxin, 2Fe-2S
MRHLKSMAGTNTKKIRSTRKFTIEFLPEKRVIEVDPFELSSGSILDVALAAGVDIDHACGGVCACATCHVIVRQGLESCSESTEDEEDQLEKAPGLTGNSRLACQCIPDGSRDLVVEVPNWNRNLVQEGR